MSQKFGLDWQEYDHQRIRSLIQVLIEENKFKDEKLKQMGKKQHHQPKFRPMIR